MPRKCSVIGCNSCYDSQVSKSGDKKVTVYSFPTDENERYSWVRSLPNKLSKVTQTMGICERHWPEDAPMIRRPKSKYHVPSCPPSIFPNVQPSCIPTSNTTTPRSTKKATSSARAMDIDEMDQFLYMDTIVKDKFVDLVREKFSNLKIHSSESETIMLSKEREGAVFRYSIFLEHCMVNDKFALKFELFREVKCIKYPDSNLKLITRWSQLEEVVRFTLNGEDVRDPKSSFLNRAITLMNSKKNKRVYSLSDLCLAFSWYSKSRALYQLLRESLQLPSLSTLRAITSVARNLEDEKLFTSVFSALPERERGCILIIDEVYVKASLCYRGGTLFGHAVDQPGNLARTMLCIMVKCFFGGKTFLAKLLPCSNLKAEFQFQAVEEVVMDLERCGGTVVSIITDNNRVNQSFFGMFEKFDDTKPWIVRTPGNESKELFIMYDTVHLMKNIRNSWLTEMSQTLHFKDENGVEKSAHWSDLRKLYERERTLPLRLSLLSEAAVKPSNIDKQNVKLVLDVFSDKTRSALLTSSSSSESSNATASFIQIVLQFWKVINAKALYLDKKQRDPDRAVVNDINSHPISVLKSWAARAKEMEPISSPRMKTLTMDTAKALNWTCNCLVDLCSFLLNVDSTLRHKYVPLGFFQQDDIEKHFAHFRMSAGCTYFITTEDIQHTHDVDRARLMLESLKDDQVSYDSAGHHCSDCQRDLTDFELLIIDDLSGALDSLTHEEKLSLYHISGYITFKDDLQGGTLCSEAMPDPAKAYTDALDRGGLRAPTESLQTMVAYCYLFMKLSSTNSCRKRLTKIFSQLPGMLHINLDVKTPTVRRIINILMKRFALLKTQQHADKSDSKRRKVTKLSSDSH